jgi:hypothetical protein
MIAGDHLQDAPIDVPRQQSVQAVTNNDCDLNCRLVSHCHRQPFMLSGKLSTAK